MSDAASIAQERACGRHGCACASTARTGRGLTHCPKHPDRRPSLAVKDVDGRVLVKCWAGCGQTEVIDALHRLGHWHASRGRYSPATTATPSAPGSSSKPVLVLRLWGSTQAAEGTVVEAYLHGRGLHGPIPVTLRCVPNLLHRPSGQRLPAMVASVTCHGEARPSAVLRTYLLPGGAGKAVVTPNKTSSEVSSDDDQRDDRRCGGVPARAPAPFATATATSCAVPGGRPRCAPWGRGPSDP
jgi:hypothetical protein